MLNLMKNILVLVLMLGGARSYEVTSSEATGTAGPVVEASAPSERTVAESVPQAIVGDVETRDSGDINLRGSKTGCKPTYHPTYSRKYSPTGKPVSRLYRPTQKPTCRKEKPTNAPTCKPKKPTICPTKRKVPTNYPTPEGDDNQWADDGGHDDDKTVDVDLDDDGSDNGDENLGDDGSDNGDENLGDDGNDDGNQRKIEELKEKNLQNIKKIIDLKLKSSRGGRGEAQHEVPKN